MTTSPASLTPELLSYCQGFELPSQTLPTKLSHDAAELVWWQDLMLGSLSGQLRGPSLFQALQSALPQLLMPQVSGISASKIYKEGVLRGITLSQTDLVAAGPSPKLQQPNELCLTLAPYLCGTMPVLRTPSWHDFELIVRALAHRAEPAALARGVHAQAVSGLIHWGLIRQIDRKCRARLIILHDAPYGSVPARHVPGNLSDSDWLIASNTWRLEHELTHLTTYQHFGEMRINLLDELIADCMGMVAAMGTFQATLFGRCLGLGNDGEPTEGGRWITYVEKLSKNDSSHAIALTMQRAHELGAILAPYSKHQLQSRKLEMFNWLCHQSLNKPISPWHGM